MNPADLLKERLEADGCKLTKRGERFVGAVDDLRRGAAAVALAGLLALTVSGALGDEEPLNKRTAAAYIVAKKGDTVYDYARAANGDKSFQETVVSLKKQSRDLDDGQLDVGDKVFLTDEQSKNFEEAKKAGETTLNVVDLGGQPIDVDIVPPTEPQ